MKEKWISSIIAGAYIAMIYGVFSIPDKIIASFFFSTGILLVLNLHNQLFTKSALLRPMIVLTGSAIWRLPGSETGSVH